MEILLFSPVRLYHPIDVGSRRRIYNIGKFFQKIGHRVHFVYYADNGMDRESFLFMQENWDSFTLIEKIHQTQRHSGNDKLNEWYEEHIASEVNMLVEKFDIDMVWCNYIFQSKFLESLPAHIYKIIDTHDVFTDRYKLFDDSESTKYTWYSYSKEDEAAALNRADTVVAITEVEAEYFTSISKAHIEVVGHIEAPHFIEKSYDTLQKVGFIGGSNDVNIIAIDTFLDDYYLHSVLKNKIEIVIAGDICQHIKDKHPEWAESLHLQLLGRVDDVDQFYDKVDLIINPLMFGTGQKIKSVEALAYGLPIISTKIGFEGIESVEPYHRLESIADLRQTMETLYHQPQKLQELAVSSRRVFDSYLQRVQGRLDHLLKTVEKHVKILHPETCSKKIEQKNTIILQQHRQITIDQIEREKLLERIASLLSCGEPEIREKEKEIEFVLKPSNERVGNIRVAYYLFKGDERMDIKWYSESYSYLLEKAKYGSGQYRIQYFIVDKSHKEPGKAKKLEQGYSAYIEIK